VGVEGEEYATEIIASLNPQCHVPNAIVPSMHPDGRVHEIDHVVLVGGTIFIVEVKNYKGWLIWEDSTRNGLLQIKTGRYGEAVEPKKARNPVLQAKRVSTLRKNIWLVFATRGSCVCGWNQWEPLHGMRISRRSIAGEKTVSPNRNQSLGSHCSPRLFLNEALANGAQ
jgi:Nuclease-related domain